MEGIIAHCYFWHLSKCSTWAPTHTTSAQACSGCPVLTHWGSEIAPPTQDDLWLRSSLCWKVGAADPQVPLPTWGHRPAEGMRGGRVEPGAKEALETHGKHLPLPAMDE